MKHTWKRKTEFVTVGHKSDAVDQVDSSVQPSVAVNQEVDDQETPTLGNRRKELEPAPKPSRQPPPAASKLRSPSWKPIKKLRSPSWKPFHTQKQDKRSHIPPPSELTMPKLVTKKREQKASQPHQSRLFLRRSCIITATANQSIAIHIGDELNLEEGLELSTLYTAALSPF
jgi:hypothetical protein